jgi:hypothetical protein
LKLLKFQLEREREKVFFCWEREREWLWVSESVWEMHFVGPHMIVVVVECYSFLLLRTKYMVLSFHSICA